MRNEVFALMLRQQPFHNVDISDSSIVWGNVDSKIMITILTNPHCNPCSRMHDQVGELLNDIGNEVCVQYIFSSFSAELESSGLFLTALYMQNLNNKSYVEKCFREWFDTGKNNRETFFKKYGGNLNLVAAESEYAKHIKWRKVILDEITPLVLINGIALPYGYKVTDISHFIQMLKN